MQILNAAKSALLRALRWSRGSTVTLNANGHGFGDAMLTAWIAEGSRRSARRLIHHATGEKADFLRLWRQELTDDAEGSVTTFDCYLNRECKEKGAVPRVYSRSQDLGIDSPPKRPRLAKLPRDATSWAKDLHRHAQNGDARRPLVMLCPQTEYRSREWPAANWVDLTWKLHSSGYAVTIQLGKDDERFHNVPRYHFGHSWGHKIALMQRCSVVIGIDSAPIHIAGTLDKPTIALLGPTNAGIVSHMPSVSCMSAPLERLDCVGCYFQTPFRAACDQGCMSLARLWPEEVLAKVRERIGPGSAARKGGLKCS